MKSRTVEETRMRMKTTHQGYLDDQTTITLDASNVPEALRVWIPYAEFWGVSDDDYREARVAQAPQSAKDDLVAVVRMLDDELDDWLAGEEAKSEFPSTEYVAFSAMRMAADSM